VQDEAVDWPPSEELKEVGALSEPRGVVGLSEALIALREQLLEAWQEGEEEGGRLRFRISEPIELTFQAAVTQEGKAAAGAKWWLLSLGGEASRSSVVTQTLHMKLAPVMYDLKTGQAADVVEIDDAR
jgi:hypothetical protein